MATNKRKKPRKRGNAPDAQTRGGARLVVDGEVLSETVAAQGPAPLPSEGQELTPYDIFNLCIDRAKNLLKLHEAAHGKAGKPEPFMADAHRAAIVLAISALDAFVRTFVMERVGNVLFDSAPLPGPLKDHITKFVKDSDLLEAARRNDLLDRVEKAFTVEFERRSFQGTRAIKEHLRLVGFENIFHDISMKANVSEDTMCAKLDDFTDRRHNIAHRGDYDLTQNPPIETAITKGDAEDCIKVVSMIAEHIHGLGK